jgi:hypothetical protein
MREACQSTFAYGEDVQDDARRSYANGTIDTDAQDEDREDHLKDAQGKESVGHDNHMRLRFNRHFYSFCFSTGPFLRE